MNEFYDKLVLKLEKLFGEFDGEHRRFTDANNAKISRELGYSDAQFSRLINGSATEGEYQRAIQNVERILTVEQLQKKLQKGGNGTVQSGPKIWIVLSALFCFLFLCVLFFHLFTAKEAVENTESLPRDHTLRWTFENSFINPYVKLDDLPVDCNYPCYKYQGKWQLEKNYKLPFFRERNGFHYLAKEAEMYARCMVEKSETGDIVEGYEYQRHEIWFDTKEWPMDSFLTENGIANERYRAMEFSNESTFVKVANVHTFFRNEFNIKDSLIIRSGKVIGRDLEILDTEALSSSLDDENKVKEIAIQLNRLVEKRLKDFSVAINCTDIPIIKNSVEDISDGDLMSFTCQMTTSRFPIEYTKTYILVDQYIKNDCIGE